MNDNDHSPHRNHDDDTAIQQVTPKLKKPSMYQVVLLNDDYTPMEFVVDLIEKFFHHSRDKAAQIMLKIHTEGKGVCGIYTGDVAETKATLVNQYSQDHQHPLHCQSEPCNE